MAMVVRSIPAEKLPLGTAFSKFLVSLAQPTATDAIAVAEQHCTAVPQVAHALRQRVKAGVGALSTSAGLPIGELSRELVLLLRERSSAMQIVQRCRRVPFKVAVARELGAGTGAAWRGEALPAPTVASMFDTLKLPYTILDAIAAATRESFRFGPVTEQALRESVTAGLASYLDDRMLNPSVAAGAASPASLTYGAETITSTGTTAAQVLADLGGMIEAIGAPLSSGCWTMRKKTFTRLCGALASVGHVASVDNLLGLPVVLVHGPQQVTLIDTDAIIAGFDEDGIGLELSSLASLEMSDAPTQDGTTGSGASMVSLWQNNLLAIKVSLPLAWAHTQFNDGSPAQPSGCVVMPVAF
jgi:hypothetical protein